MAETIRVGLVGARFAARFHWEMYRHVYGVPVQVVGSRPTRRSRGKRSPANTE
jgi:hypothetical protein